MGMFNAGSKESNSSSSSTTNTTTAIDSRMVTDGSGIGLNFGGGNSNIVQLLDGGTIAGAFNTVNDVTSNSLAASGVNLANTLNTLNNAVGWSIEGIGGTAQRAMQGMGDTIARALNYSNDVTSNSLAAAGIAMNNSLAASQRVFDHASEIVANQGTTNSADFKTLLGATLQLSQQAYTAMDSNLGLAKELNQASQDAYTGASEQAAGNKNIVMVGLVVVGLAAVLAFGDKF